MVFFEVSLSLRARPSRALALATLGYRSVTPWGS
jgi:hypothetical protein